MSISLQTHQDTSPIPSAKGRRIVYDPDERNGVPNTIELRAKNVEVTGNIAKHLFWVYTNDSGQEFYLAGYPEKPFPDFGQIVLESGEYTENTPDFKPYFRLATISGDPQSVYQAYLDLKNTSQDLHNAKIPYSSHQNSNSFAMTAGRILLESRGIESRGFRRFVSNELVLPGVNNDLSRFLQRERDQIDNKVTFIQGIAAPYISPQDPNGIAGPMVEGKDGEDRTPVPDSSSILHTANEHVIIGNNTENNRTSQNTDILSSPTTSSIKDNTLSNSEIKTTVLSVLQVLNSNGGQPFEVQPSYVFGINSEGTIKGVNTESGKTVLAITQTGEINSNFSTSEHEALNRDLTSVNPQIVNENRQQDNLVESGIAI